jgi:hypothetical protein
MRFAEEGGWRRIRLDAGRIVEDHALEPRAQVR